ncbi:hypothetical protein BOX37_03480 [Nocardia mangyaensis]|uniref:Uncharacterized protein n=1 Tax=Nocardia mangyaensis TaxID=2213200 RepID=A0A1J0VMB8_9NOCA|nr:hypothetical protein [Nocardia mangyaensis]APE33180.1 hypothetical protein BOX37_03480 [Nocardia mangyaensis]
MTGDGQGNDGVEITYDDVDGPWVYAVHGRLVGGNPMITQLTITPRDPGNPQPINQTNLRKMPFSLVFDRVKRTLRAEGTLRVSQLRGDMRTQIAKIGRSRSGEHYIQVAWTYLEAEAAGRPPRQAIAEHWDVSPVTASRWLSEARKRGYLEPYSAGVPRKPVIDLWDRQQQVNSTIEQSVVLAFLDRVVQRHLGESLDTAVASILDTLLALGAEAMKRTASISDGKDLLSSEMLLNELFARAESDQTEEVRSAALVLLAALISEQDSGHGDDDGQPANGNEGQR